ncbi:hypothetical protein NQZ68_034400 [Dissostichus eleginoides]|nr:hypothetical protein NQZ68_034400 [Dissostichus eleginoides]
MAQIAFFGTPGATAYPSMHWADGRTPGRSPEHHSSESRASKGLDDIMAANLMSQPYPEGDHYPGLAAH